MNDENRKAMFAKKNVGSGVSSKDFKSMSEKELVKSIKGGKKDWREWDRKENNEEFYQEIERRNQEIPKPTGLSNPKVFRDDPDAVEKMEQKIEYWKAQKDYWSKIIKFPARDYHHHALGDMKWYQTSLVSKNLRDAEKKLEQIKTQQASGTKLVRKPTYRHGGKRFYYAEEKNDD